MSDLGDLVKALSDGVGDHLAGIVEDLGVVRARLIAIGEACGAVNGLSGDCAGWADRLSTMAQEITKEAGEVQAKLLGKRKAEVTVHHNPELASKAKAARGEAA